MQIPNLTEEGRLLTRAQLAERWSVSRETIKRREKDGTLPVLKLGRDARYRLSDVLRLEREAEVRR
jgi:DNA-binding XRE family transcriptional regulator